VIVNDLQVRLFEINKSTVADALLGAGINMRKTQPRLGMALTVVVNGKLKIIKGGRGQAAVVKLNGEEVTIDSPVKNEDVIQFIPAEDGPDARGFIYDVVPQIMSLSVTVNGEDMAINPVITMNSQLATYYDELVDNARINYYLPKTGAEIMEIAGFTDNDHTIYVNERIVDVMSEIEDGDDIIIENIAGSAEQNGQEAAKSELAGVSTGLVSATEEETEKDGDSGSETNEHMTATENHSKSSNEVIDSSGSVPGITVVYVNQERVEIPRENIILTDILTRVSFPLIPPKVGSKLVLQVNGISAEFTTPLKWGDNVILEWV